MSESEKDKIILELQRRVDKIEGRDEEGIATYSFSKIKFKELKELFDVKINFIDKTKFDNWFDFTYSFSKDDINILTKLIEKNSLLMERFKEEDLKAKFIIPLLNQVDFLYIEENIRDFYDEKLTYKTDKFILNGETDFMIAEGLEESEKPYFFIQEFKKGKLSSDPEPQLLAELISAVELNDETVIKGAYIVGAIWNFVILEKLGEKKYQYFVSENFDSTKIADLKNIYKNLVFVREEILERVKRETREKIPLTILNKA